MKEQLNDQIKNAIQFIMSQINSDGSVNEPGEIYSKSMQVGDI